VALIPYNAKAIAKGQGQSLTPMKIQKLVYFGHGWHLAIKDAPLIFEQVEAWSYGPVIPSLYQAFRQYGNQPIETPATTFLVHISPDEDENFEFRRTIPSLEDKPDQADSVRMLLDRVWQIYGRFSAVQLSNLTHQPGTPWYKVYTEYEGQLPKRTDIPMSYIKDYFKSLAREAASVQ
jgi:uncharacterized phage-associated protein